MVDIIVSAFSDLIAHALELCITIVCSVFDFSFAKFNEVFPFAANAYSVLQDIALGIAFLLAAIQIIMLLFQSRQTSSTPTRILILAGLSVFCIYYGNYVLEWVMEIAQLPYDALLKMYAADNSGADFASGISVGWTTISLSIETLTMGASVGPSVLLYIFLLLMVGIAFIKLLIEAVERYVILFVLVYLSPLASSTLASDMTSGIFKKYLAMFISQCILLILNIWSLEMVVSMFANAGATSPALALLMGYAFIRIASRMDSYLNQLGLNSAVTGIGLGGELMATGMAMMARMGSGAGGAGATGGIQGVAQKVTDGIKRFTPTGPAQDAVSGFYKSVAQGFGVGKAAAAETEGGYLDKLRAGGEAGFSAGKNGFADNWTEASKEGAKTNLWSRSLYTDGAEHPGMDILGKDSITADDLNDIATTPYLGDDIMRNLSDGAVIEDPATVAATMQSIGFDGQSDEASEAVAVGYGNAAADNISFSASENGIHAQYERDGKVHDLDIKTGAQYDSLTPQEQQAYTGFKNREGTQYYYSHDAHRADSPYQKQQAAAQASYNSIMADPMGTMHTPESLAHMKKTPGALGDYINAFDNGVIPPQQAFDTWKSIQPEGMLRTGYNQGLDMLSRGQATMTRSDGVTQLSWKDPASGEGHSFSVSTSPFGDTTVPMKQADGSVLYGSYQSPPTVQERARSTYNDAIANPQSVPLTSESMDYMRRTSGALEGYINAFCDGPIPQQQATDTWSMIQAGGSLSKPYSQGLDMLARGQASMVRDGGVDTLNWNDPSSGEAHRFSVSTQPIGEQSIPMKQRDGSVLYGSYQAPPSQEERILSAAKTFGSSFGTGSSISSEDWAAAQNFRPAMKNQLMTDVYDSYAATNGSVSLPDSTEVRSMVADRLDALDYRSLGLNQRDVSEFSSKLRSGEAQVIHESSHGTQVEFKDGNRHRTFTLVTNYAIENVGPEIQSQSGKYSPEFLGNRGFSLKNVGKGGYYAALVEDLPEDQFARKTKRVKLGKNNH